MSLLNIFFLLILILWAELGTAAQQKNESKFPMCESFLSVKWLNEKALIGTTNYEIHTSNGIESVARLVVLGRYPAIDYEIPEEYSGSDGLKKLEDIVSSGSFNPIISADKRQLEFDLDGEQFVFQPKIMGASESLGLHKKTICVLYPDSSKVWIVEYPSVSAIFSENEQNKVLSSVSRQMRLQGVISIEELDGFFSGYDVLDINHDGVVDYPIKGIYSVGNRYYIQEPVSNNPNDEDYWTYKFPPSEASCVQDPFDSYFITSDGVSFYLNDKCNLSVLTTQGEK